MRDFMHIRVMHWGMGMKGGHRKLIRLLARQAVDEYLQRRKKAQDEQKNRQPLKRAVNQ